MCLREKHAENYPEVAKHICKKKNLLSLYSNSKTMKEVLYEVRCLKSTEDMILALAGQFKQLSHEP